MKPVLFLRNDPADTFGVAPGAFEAARVPVVVCHAIDGEAPPPLDDVLKTMRERVGKFNVEKIKPQDLASMAGAPPDED